MRTGAIGFFCVTLAAAVSGCGTPEEIEVRFLAPQAAKGSMFQAGGCTFTMEVANKTKERLTHVAVPVGPAKGFGFIGKWMEVRDVGAGGTGRSSTTYRMNCGDEVRIDPPARCELAQRDCLKLVKIVK